jgi:hypothetical protein
MSALKGIADKLTEVEHVRDVPRSGNPDQTTERQPFVCYRVPRDWRSFLVVTDTTNLIADLRVEGSLFQRLV